jgi:hypothetical protein
MTQTGLVGAGPTPNPKRLFRSLEPVQDDWPDGHTT